jgi:putative ABC transport system permease protein
LYRNRAVKKCYPHKLTDYQLNKYWYSFGIATSKEVGIRKVLGASVQHIVYLFSKEFTILIGIAFLIAAPAGYYFLHEWLSEFYYHTSMGWTVFAIAMIASVIIAWCTVGYRAVKAALVNPVKSLKTE